MIRPYLQLPRTVYILALGSFINRAGAFFIVFLTIYLEEHLHLGERFATRTMGDLPPVFSPPVMLVQHHSKHTPWAGGAERGNRAERSLPTAAR